MNFRYKLLSEGVRRKGRIGPIFFKVRFTTTIRISRRALIMRVSKVISEFTMIFSIWGVTI